MLSLIARSEPPIYILWPYGVSWRESEKCNFSAGCRLSPNSGTVLLECVVSCAESGIQWDAVAVSFCAQESAVFRACS